VHSRAIAEQALARAVERAGVSVRTLQDLTDLDRARAIFDATWPMAAGGSNLPSNLFRALVHAGAYASVAYDGDEPVGATVAFIGLQGGQVILHSHMAAVREGHRNRSIGTAMKSHQRLWALDNDIPVISWTFDPLVRRNLRLNMLKLGAEVRDYERNFYGRMDDDYEFTDESDRVFAWWVVDSDRANLAALGDLRPQVPGPGARVIEIPEDIVALRQTDLDASSAWRLRVREQMEGALADGYHVSGVTPEGNYVMERT
jgi:predicted GNAT superfamily acetyltransferase